MLSLFRFDLLGMSDHSTTIPAAYVTIWISRIRFGLLGALYDHRQFGGHAVDSRFTHTDAPASDSRRNPCLPRSAARACTKGFAEISVACGQELIMDACAIWWGGQHLRASESLCAGDDPRKTRAVSTARYDSSLPRRLAPHPENNPAGQFIVNATYVSAGGSPGYFQLATMCYDREGLPRLQDATSAPSSRMTVNLLHPTLPEIGATYNNASAYDSHYMSIRQFPDRASCRIAILAI